MKLIKVVCPNCNSHLEMEDGQKNFKCEYCGTNILLDDEVIKVDHVIHDNEKDESIKKAEALIKFKEYDKAAIEYKKLIEKYSYDPEMYFKYIECETENFSYDPFGYTDCYNEFSIKSAYKDIKNCTKEPFEKYTVLETNKSMLKKRTEKYNKYFDDLETKYKEVEIQWKKDAEESRKAVTLFFILFFIMIILLIIFACYKTNKNQKEELVRQQEVDRIKNIENKIKCNAYCNNSLDDTSVFEKVNVNDSIYCHFEINEGEPDYEYALSYKIYRNNEKTYTYNESASSLYKVGENGYIYWNENKDNPLNWDKVRVEIYNSRNNAFLCYASIIITR